MIAGYVVDLIEPLLFVLTAAFGAFVARLAPDRARGILLLASAAILTALLEGGPGHLLLDRPPRPAHLPAAPAGFFSGRSAFWHGRWPGTAGCSRRTAG